MGAGAIILTICNIASVIGGGYAGIYALQHEFRDTNGKITIYGKRALNGIIIATIVSLISLFVNLYLDRINEKAKQKTYEDQIEAQKETITKLNLLTSNTNKLSFPLSDFQIEIHFAVNDTCASIGPIHYRIQDIIRIINNGEDLPEGFDKRTDSLGLRSILVQDFEKADINLDILPTGLIGLFSRDKNPNSFQDKKQIKDDGVNDMRFRIPLAENLIKNQSIEFSYMVREHKYYITISFSPNPEFSNGRLTNFLDLNSERIGFALLGRYRQEDWPIEKIVFKNKLGYEVSFYGLNMKNTGKAYPYFTRYSN
jgi:hypothetical protein